MPRIFDDIEEHGHFIEAIQRSVLEAYRADFCVGYFNLRKWRATADTLNRQLRSGISDERLADLVLDLRAEDRLCIVSDGGDDEDGVRIVCSLGMV